MSHFADAGADLVLIRDSQSVNPPPSKTSSKEAVNPPKPVNLASLPQVSPRKQGRFLIIEPPQVEDDDFFTDNELPSHSPRLDSSITPLHTSTPSTAPTPSSTTSSTYTNPFVGSKPSQHEGVQRLTSPTTSIPPTVPDKPQYQHTFHSNTMATGNQASISASGTKMVANQSNNTTKINPSSSVPTRTEPAQDVAGPGYFVQKNNDGALFDPSMATAFGWDKEETRKDTEMKISAPIQPASSNPLRTTPNHHDATSKASQTSPHTVTKHHQAAGPVYQEILQLPKLEHNILINPTNTPLTLPPAVPSYHDPERMRIRKEWEENIRRYESLKERAAAERARLGQVLAKRNEEAKELEQAAHQAQIQEMLSVLRENLGMDGNEGQLSSENPITQEATNQQSFKQETHKSASPKAISNTTTPTDTTPRSSDETSSEMYMTASASSSTFPSGVAVLDLASFQAHKRAGSLQDSSQHSSTQNMFTPHEVSSHSSREETNLSVWNGQESSQAKTPTSPKSPLPTVTEASREPLCSSTSPINNKSPLNNSIEPKNIESKNIQQHGSSEANGGSRAAMEDFNNNNNSNNNNNNNNTMNSSRGSSQSHHSPKRLSSHSGNNMGPFPTGPPITLDLSGSGEYKNERFRGSLGLGGNLTGGTDYNNYNRGSHSNSHPRTSTSSSPSTSSPLSISPRITSPLLTRGRPLPPPPGEERDSLSPSNSVFTLNLASVNELQLDRESSTRTSGTNTATTSPLSLSPRISPRDTTDCRAYMRSPRALAAYKQQQGLEAPSTSSPSPTTPANADTTVNTDKPIVRGRSASVSKKIGVIFNKLFESKSKSSVSEKDKDKDKKSSRSARRKIKSTAIPHSQVTFKADSVTADSSNSSPNLKYGGDNLTRSNSMERKVSLGTLSVDLSPDTSTSTIGMVVSRSSPDLAWTNNSPAGSPRGAVSLSSDLAPITESPSGAAPSIGRVSSSLGASSSTVPSPNPARVRPPVPPKSVNLRQTMSLRSKTGSKEEFCLNDEEEPAEYP